MYNIEDLLGKEFDETILKDIGIEIPDSVKKMMAELEEMSGRPFCFKLVDDRSFAPDATIRIGRGVLTKHVITLNMSRVKELKSFSYLIAHELQHALRIYKSESKYQRVYIALNRETQSYVKDFIAKNKGKLLFPEEAKVTIVTGLINNLITLILNAPVDVAIENELSKDEYGLREYQIKYLKGYCDRMVEELGNKSISKMFPASLVNTIQAIQYAYIKGISDIVGKQYLNKYKGYKDIVSRGEVLYKIFSMEDTGQKSDIEKVDKLLAECGLDSVVSTAGFVESSAMYR